MKTARERMSEGRTSLIMLQPFYGTLAMHLEMVESTKFNTMATNGRQLFYNAAFVETLSEPELIGVIAHEVSHCAYKHHTRRAQRDADVWNEAGDYVINRDLKRAMFVLPSDALHDDRFDKMTTEEVFTVLMTKQQQQQDQQQQQQQSANSDGTCDDPNNKQQTGDDYLDDDEDEGDDAGCPNEGGDEFDPGSDDDEGEAGAQDQADSANESDADGDEQEAASDDSGEGEEDGSAPASNAQQAPKDKGRCGTVLDAAEPGSGSAEEIDTEWDVLVRQAINVATKLAGKLPGHLERLAQATREPKEDWREFLRRFIDSTSRCDYSFSRPNRRFLHSGMILPGKVPDGMNHLGLGIDVSGSISVLLVNQFVSEIQAALDEGVADRVTVAYFDDGVRRVEEYVAGEKIVPKIVGGGGTNFVPVIEHFKTLDVACLVIFTDMYGTFGLEPEYPVLWANFEMNGVVAPWGETIAITL